MCDLSFRRVRRIRVSGVSLDPRLTLGRWLVLLRFPFSLFLSRAMSAAPAASPVDVYKRQANEVLDLIDDKLSAYPAVQQIAAKTTLRPSHLTLGAVSLLIAFIWWSENRSKTIAWLCCCRVDRNSHFCSFLCCCFLRGFGGRLFSNLVGFGWPLWESFDSLKRKAAPGEVDEEDMHWLTYWVVYSTFTLVESGTNVLELWIPMYHLVKIVFLLWCMLPQTRGALVIYSAVIEPLLVRYEGKIDATQRKARSAASTVAKDFESAAEGAIDSKKRELVDEAIASMVGGGHKKQASSMSGEGSAPGGPAEVVEHDHTKSQ